MGLSRAVRALTLSLAVAGTKAVIYADPTKVLSNSYDYIVVGGGAGGAVVAKRLSELSNIKVLLVEAGPMYASASFWKAHPMLMLNMFQQRYGRLQYRCAWSHGDHRAHAV